MSVRAALLAGVLSVVVGAAGCASTRSAPAAPAPPQPSATGSVLSAAGVDRPGTDVPAATPSGSAPVEGEPGGDPLPTPVDAAALAALPRSTTFTTVRGAPTGPGGPGAGPSGIVLHPQRDTAVWTAPGGRAIATLPTDQLGSPTWVPVTATRGGWSRVLLPSKPNGSAGWIHTDTDGFDLARSDAVVRVDVTRARMTIDRSGERVGSWPVVVGSRATPTPTGTTFLMASVYDAGNPYSTHLLPLGWHSETLDTFGGGPGTVALHGWRDRSVFTSSRRQLSHGCVRIPDDALALALQLPLGTPVVIT